MVHKYEGRDGSGASDSRKFLRAALRPSFQFKCARCESRGRSHNETLQRIAAGFELYILRRGNFPAGRNVKADNYLRGRIRIRMRAQQNVERLRAFLRVASFRNDELLGLKSERNRRNHAQRFGRHRRSIRVLRENARAGIKIVAVNLRANVRDDER